MRPYDPRPTLWSATTVVACRTIEAYTPTLIRPGTRTVTIQRSIPGIPGCIVSTWPADERGI